MDTLIIGHQGQLGHALTQRLPEATGVDLEECDVTDPAAVAALMKSENPNLVFNTTAYNAVDAAETDYENALRVNAIAPGRMAAACRERDAEFVHFSTDYVFGNGYAEPIDEGATPLPLSAYGRSKLLGERMALQNNPATYIVRTTGLYSHRRHNFVRTMIRLGLERTELKVVNDQFVSPTWVDPLAASVMEVVQGGVYGVFHITSQAGCTWYEFAGRLFEMLDINVRLHAVDQDEWGAPARRPLYSVLDDALIRALRYERLGRWDDMLEAFLARHGAELVEELSQQKGVQGA